MSRNKSWTILILVMLLVVGNHRVFAQTTEAQQLQNESDQLQQQLQEIESQIANYEQQLSTVQSEKNTLANKIKQLQNKQAALLLKIKETKLKIAHLDSQLGATEKDITVHEKRMDVLKYDLGVVLREIYQRDNYSTLEMLLVNDNLSDFYTELNNDQSINDSLGEILQQVQSETAGLAVKKKNLDDQKSEQQNLISIINLQKQQLTSTISDQNELYQETKGKESNYQKVLADTRKKAAEIRSRIYELFDVGKQITFGDVVPIANWAAQQTGVRAAFLLAILTQESNLGKNVGTCNRLGDPPSKGWRVIMKPDRDQQPFVAVTTALALDTDTTPVSCPMHDSRGRQIGWGGAMGPAQFIPSTWLGYKDQVASLTGKAANPWDIRDAFLAAAIKLKAGGAGSTSGEWAAAMRYFSGSTNLKYRFYGDNVVAMAKQYQSDIDALNN